jgi:hypothetical protein
MATRKGAAHRHFKLTHSDTGLLVRKSRAATTSPSFLSASPSVTVLHATIQISQVLFDSMHPKQIFAPFDVILTMSGVPRDRSIGTSLSFFRFRKYIYSSLSAILSNIMSAVFDIIFAGGKLVCTSRSRELCSSNARRNDGVCHRREISCRRPFSQDPHRRKWPALSRPPSPCPALQIHRAPSTEQHYCLLPCCQTEPAPKRTRCCRSMRPKRGRRLRCQL